MTERTRLAPSLVVGFVLAGLFIALALFAPLFLHGQATALTSDVREAPSMDHWLGTDEYGRDILARTLVAVRLTLLMATAATAISVILGTVVGGAAWLLPTVLRETVLRLVDSCVAFPPLVLGLIIAAILGPGAVSAVVAIGVAGIPSFARLASNLTASIIGRDYVVTARLLGVPSGALLTRHLLPNIGGPLLMIATSSFALTLLDISSLSFVGLGVQSPQFDLGLVLNESLASIYVQPFGALGPSLMLTLAGITVMLIGDGIGTTLQSGGHRRRTSSHVRRRPSGESAHPDALVDVTGLSITARNGRTLVDDVSFSVARGEILGIVGESGSGKSTTAMALAGLSADGLRVEAAALRVGDLDLLGRPSSRRLATEIGMIYQDPGTTFNPVLRMGAQLTEVARVHLGMGRGAARRRLVSSLGEIRIREPERRMTQRPHELSGGMLQRSAIASSLVTEPILIVADEATTALDVTVQADVLRQFRRVNREHGTAMLCISHDIGVVGELCDRVIVMCEGEIVETLPADRLRAGEATHPYTRQLLAAKPTLSAMTTTGSNP